MASPSAGVGIEGDGFYSVDLDPSDDDQSPEEIIAVAATQGFEAPLAIRGNQILVDGVRLPFVNAAQTGVQAPAFSSLAGNDFVSDSGRPDFALHSAHTRRCAGPLR